MKDDSLLAKMQSKMVHAVMFRRLEPDLDLGFRQYVANAILNCGSADKAGAASLQAFEDAQRWSKAVVFGVIDLIESRYGDALRQIGVASSDHTPHTIDGDGPNEA